MQLWELWELWAKMNIKNIFALVIVSVLSNICLAGDSNITCKGENYSKTNITNLETNDGTEIRTFRIILNKINNMQNCPIAKRLLIITFIKSRKGFS